MGPLGFQEILVIFIIALIVFGPKKLPELGKSLGKGLREFKRATEDLKSNWEDHIKDAENSIEDVKRTVTDTPAEVNAKTDEKTGESHETAEKTGESHELPKEPAVATTEVRPDGHTNRT